MKTKKHIDPKEIYYANIGKRHNMTFAYGH